jgi:hypothetical protein
MTKKLSLSWPNGFSSTGELDSSLSGAAITATSPNTQSGEDSEVLFEANGDILSASISGNINRASSNVVERFTTPGAQDPSFTTTGFEFGDERRWVPVALTVQSNGKILIGREVNEVSPLSGGFARLNATGGLDTTFGTAGQVTTANPVNGVLIQADGKIVAVQAVSTDGISLARYLPN